MAEVSSKDVGRPKTANSDQLVVRVTPELRERLKELVPFVAPPGVSTTMTDVARAALLLGVEALEARRKAAEEPHAATSKKRGK